MRRRIVGPETCKRIVTLRCGYSGGTRSSTKVNCKALAIGIRRIGGSKQRNRSRVTANAEGVCGQLDHRHTHIPRHIQGTGNLNLKYTSASSGSLPQSTIETGAFDNRCRTTDNNLARSKLISQQCIRRFNVNKQRRLIGRGSNITLQQENGANAKSATTLKRNRRDREVGDKS